MATPPSRIDSSVIKWALLYLLILCTFVIAAEIVSEGDSSPLVTQILTVAAPIGAVLIFAVKGGEQGSRIEEKTDEQTTTLGEIKHAVNGKMDARFNALEFGHATLVTKVSSVETDIADIRDMLKRVLEE